MCAARPPTDGSNAEDVQDRAPRADLCASAAPSKACENNAEEEQVREAAEVGMEKEIKEEERGEEGTEDSPGQVWGFVLVFFNPRLCLLNI